MFPFHPNYSTDCATNDVEIDETDEKTLAASKEKQTRIRSARNRFVTRLKLLLAVTPVSPTFVERFWADEDALCYQIAHVGYQGRQRVFELGVGINPNGDTFKQSQITQIVKAQGKEREKKQPFIEEGGTHTLVKLNNAFNLYIPLAWNTTELTDLVFVDVKRPDDPGAVIAVFLRKHFENILAEWNETLVHDEKDLDMSDYDVEPDASEDTATVHPPAPRTPGASHVSYESEQEDEESMRPPPPRPTTGGKSFPGARKGPPQPSAPPPRPTTGNKTFRGAQLQMPRPTAAKSPRPSTPDESARGTKRKEPDTAVQAPPPSKSARLTMSTGVPRGGPCAALAREVVQLLWEQPDATDVVSGAEACLPKLCPNVVFYDYALAVRHMNRILRRDADIRCGIGSDSLSSSNDDDDDDYEQDPADFFPRPLGGRKLAEDNTTYITQWLSNNSTEIDNIRFLMHRAIAIALGNTYKPPEQLPSARAVASLVRGIIRTIHTNAPCASCNERRRIPGEDKCAECTLF